MKRICISLILISSFLLPLGGQTTGASTGMSKDATPPLQELSREEFSQLPSQELARLMEEYIMKGEELYAMEQYKASLPYFERAGIIGDILTARARQTREMRALRQKAEERLKKARETVDSASKKMN